jgi:myo-inositol-1(or 4)-monophosphatase
MPPAHGNGSRRQSTRGATGVSTDLKSLLALAESAAVAAAKPLEAEFGAARPPEQEDARDVKLEADRESEERIREVLAESGIPVLGEEAGFKGSEREDGLRWIVDPLDGTHNFLRGFPICCISIALWRGEAPLLGVVRDIRGETFTAIAEGDDRGAWLDGAAMSVSDIARRDRAVLMTGFPVRTDFSNEAITTFIDEIQTYRKVRMLGSAAMMLASVASGRADVYKENDVAVWDVAAGLALILGAGGQMVLGPSKKVNCYRVFATNGTLQPNA